MGRGVPKIIKEKLDCGFYHYDLPEDVEDLDCLCSPEGPILLAQQLAAQAFGAANTWFLCNGSTGGLMAAILALVRIHRRKNSRHQDSVVIVPRNCHKSIIQGLVIAGAEAVYITPVHDNIMQIAHGCRIKDIQSALTAVSQPEALLVPLVKASFAFCSLGLGWLPWWLYLRLTSAPSKTSSSCQRCATSTVYRCWWTKPTVRTCPSWGSTPPCSLGRTWWSRARTRRSRRSARLLCCTRAAPLTKHRRGVTSGLARNCEGR